VAVLLAAVVGLVSGGKRADASPAAGTSSPLIVARGKLFNQTGEIPQTTIFIPSATGLYRVSAYMVETAPASATNANWSFNLFWTDDAGAEANYENMYLPVNGGYGTPTWTPGSVSVFQADAGQSVSYSVTLSGADSGGAYALYYTVERLQ
jgi:hypothetical protein